MGLARFMASAAGRLLRIAVGIVLFVIGVTTAQGVGAWILGVVGIGFMAVGVFNVCVLAPLFGGPFWGKDVKQAA